MRVTKWKKPVSNWALQPSAPPSIRGGAGGQRQTRRIVRRQRGEVLIDEAVEARPIAWRRLFGSEIPTGEEKETNSIHGGFLLKTTAYHRRGGLIQSARLITYAT